MAELVLVGFTNDRGRAAVVLDELRETQEPWTAELRDALAIYRDAHGTFIVDRSHEPSRATVAIGAAIVGACIGLALGLVALALTSAALVCGVLVVAGALVGVGLGVRLGVGDGASWWNELAVPRELRSAVRRDGSAILIRCPVTRQHEVVDHVQRLVADAAVVLQSPAHVYAQPATVVPYRQVR